MTAKQYMQNYYYQCSLELKEFEKRKKEITKEIWDRYYVTRYNQLLEIMSKVELTTTTEWKRRKGA